MHAYFHKIQRITKRESPFAIGLPAIIWQFAFFYFPLLYMALTSVLKISGEGNFKGITMRNFLPLFSPHYLVIIANSLFLASMTACFCLLIAYPLAYFITSKEEKRKILLLFFLIIPFSTHCLLHVYAWFFVLERGGFINNLLQTLGVIREPIHLIHSPFATVLMMVYYYLPFMTLPIVFSLDRIDRRLFEASDDLGSSARQTFVNIALPLTLPAIRAGFFLVFIPAFGEFIIPELMGGDKRYFIGNVISQYILGHGTRGMGAAFTIVSCLALTAAIFGIYELFKKIAHISTRVIR